MKPPLTRGLHRACAPNRLSVPLRLTRHRARFVRSLMRFAHPLRGVRPTRNERELRRLQRGIDFAAPERDGFYVQSTGVDIDARTVLIELITARTDHLAYFRARYGSDVTTRVIATEPTSPVCAQIFAYRVTPDGATLLVAYESGGGARFDHSELAEYDDRVEIAIVVQKPNGPTTLESRRSEQAVALNRPLGARAVLDTAKRLIPNR